MKKKIITSLVLLLIIIQFFPINTAIPQLDPSTDFCEISNISDQNIGLLIKNACYDCHSEQTKYPAYTRIQPIGWWTRGHVRGGKQKLNFSKWSSYKANQQNHKLEECVEVLEEARMPLKSYTWLHPESKLSSEDKKLLINFFASTASK